MQALKFGGGSFLVPYLIMSLTVATPMLFMEMTLGQYSGRGPTQVGKVEYIPPFRDL